MDCFLEERYTAIFGFFAQLALLTKGYISLFITNFEIIDFITYSFQKVLCTIFIKTTKSSMNLSKKIPPYMSKMILEKVIIADSDSGLSFESKVFVGL